MDQEQTTQVIATLARIEETCVGIKETNKRHEASIETLYEKSGDHDKFAARVKGVTKGATASVGVLALIAGAVAKAKGMF